MDWPVPLLLKSHPEPSTSYSLKLRAVSGNQSYHRVKELVPGPPVHTGPGHLFSPPTWPTHSPQTYSLLRIVFTTSPADGMLSSLHTTCPSYVTWYLIASSPAMSVEHSTMSTHHSWVVPICNAVQVCAGVASCRLHMKGGSIYYHDSVWWVHVDLE